MFTGCTDHCGKILNIEANPGGKRLHIACNFNDLTLGESIAVNGICLTVTAFDPTSFYCDVSPETLDVTNAQHFSVNSLVNLERSLRLNDRLNGHFVMGHVDQIGRVAAQKPWEDYVEYRIDGLLPENKAFLIHKGSVAVNGVSLTLNQVADDGFSVMLIPETLRNTNLSSLKVGDWVNVEYDYLAKLMAKHLQMSHV